MRPAAASEELAEAHATALPTLPYSASTGAEMDARDEGRASAQARTAGVAAVGANLGEERGDVAQMDAEKEKDEDKMEPHALRTRTGTATPSDADADAGVDVIAVATGNLGADDARGAASGARAPGGAPATAATTEAARASAINVLTIFAIVAGGASAAGFGYENALISPLAALPAFVARYQGPNAKDGGELVLSATNQNLLFSIPLVGSLLGALAATPLQNWLGRRGTLLFCYVLSLAPLFLELFAPNLVAFVLARFWNGLYYGAALAVGPLYLADVVPVALRGRAVSSQNILTIGSQTLATVTVWATHARAGAASYRIPLAVQCAIPVLLIALTLPLPESPVWLVAKGRTTAARASLARLRAAPAAHVELELAELQRAEAARRRSAARVRFRELFARGERERTLVSALIFSLNQCSGIILSTTFSALFLVQLGVAQPFLLNVASSLCQLAGALAAPALIDRVGRRPLAIYGVAALAALDFAAGALAFYTRGRPDIATAIAGLSFVFNFVWTLSFYSISLLTPSEYPAPRLRTPTMSYAIFNGQLTAVVTTFAVPQIVAADAAGLGAKAYLIFGACCVVFTALAYVYLPETAGRTPREIDELYRSGIPKRLWAGAEVRLLDAPSASDGASASGSGSDAEKSAEGTATAADADADTDEHAQPASSAIIILPAADAGPGFARRGSVGPLARLWPRRRRAPAAGSSADAPAHAHAHPSGTATPRSPTPQMQQSPFSPALAPVRAPEAAGAQTQPPMPAPLLLAPHEAAPDEQSPPRQHRQQEQHLYRHLTDTSTRTEGEAGGR